MALSLDEAISKALELFPYLNDLKNEQRECIEALMQKKDVLGLLPTGFGKSLIYQLFPRIFELVTGKNECHVLVVSALKAITDEQVQEMNELGITSAAIGDSKVTDDKILKGEFALVFGSAEMWLRKEWIQRLKSSKLQISTELIVIDEAHVSQTWGKAVDKKKAFREAYGEIGSLRSFAKKGTPLLALTATVERRSRGALVKLLGMHSVKVINVSVNNTNLRFSAPAVKKGLSCFNWLIDEISINQQTTPKTIIFCRSITDISTLLSCFLKKLGDRAYLDKENKSTTTSLLGVYHSNTPDELKDRVKTSLKNNDGPVRVALATSALSLGVNFKDIRYVIHYGPAPDIRNQLQEAGRAGRDGKPSFNIIFYHGQQLKNCDKEIKSCIKVETCLRVALFKGFVESVKPLEVGHDCCHNCHKTCTCNSESCKVDVPMYETTVSPEVIINQERSITDEDTADLKSALLEIQETLNNGITFPVLGNRVLAHGFSDDVIKGIVADASHIFDIEYLIENHHVTSIQLARDIIEVFRELFEDFDIASDALFCQPLNTELDFASANFETANVNSLEDVIFADYFDSASDSSDLEEEFLLSEDDCDQVFVNN